jgi:hypothetical protein
MKCTNWSFAVDKKTGLSKRAAALLSTGKGISSVIPKFVLNLVFAFMTP